MRQEPWETIERTLLGTNGTPQANGQRMLVVTGMGGCGKTQLILKFMRVHQEKCVVSALQHLILLIL
jgi:GTPase SAR1 family protein